MSIRSGALRNTLFSSIGIYVEYSLGMLAAILIARQLGPQHYGIYGLFIWFAAIGVVATNSGITTGVIKFVAELRGAGKPSLVQVSEATGAVSPARQGGGDPFARAVRRVHEGEGWGPIWTVLVFVTGLAPALLGITGLIIWLSKQQRRRAFAQGG